MRNRNLLITLESNWGLLLLASSVVVFISLIGLIFYVRGQDVMEWQLKERLKDTAAAAAMQFDGSAFDGIHTRADMDKPVFKAIVARLDAMRTAIPTVRFAYLMRQTKDLNTMTFIADADSLATPAQLDTNHDGIVDQNEQPSYPGDTYDTTNFPAMREAFSHPAVDSGIGMDQWGSLISGYAPVRDAKGKTVAILGIDMDAAEYITSSHSVFSPITLLMVVVLATVIACMVFVSMWKRKLSSLKRIDIERTGLLRLALHQLGNPLSILKWSVEILQDHNVHKMNDSTVDDQLKSMEEGIARLNDILVTLKEADDVRQGTLRYTGKFCSLSTIVQAVAKEDAERLKRNKQMLELDLKCDVQIKLDEKLITSVLRELLSNAMSYTRPEGHIRIATSCENGMVRIDVRDDGVGIPVSDLPRIFDQFVRGSNAMKYRPDGSGLGLYIVRGIIQYAGGDIGIKSQEGKGTTVSFTLPMLSET